MLGAQPVHRLGSRAEHRVCMGSERRARNEGGSVGHFLAGEGHLPSVCLACGSAMSSRPQKTLSCHSSLKHKVELRGWGENVRRLSTYSLLLWDVSLLLW